MLEPQGRLFLEILGKPLKGPGILLAADLPEAIAKIEAAIQAEENQLKEAQAIRAALAVQAPKTVADERDPDTVWLRQRAKPLLEMFRRSLAANHDVVWGL